MEVQFPKSQNSGNKPVYALNGYYDEKPAELKNGFKPPKNQFLAPVDQRLVDPT